jgi:hypothetical protein
MLPCWVTQYERALRVPACSRIVSWRLHRALRNTHGRFTFGIHYLNNGIINVNVLEDGQPSFISRTVPGG